MGTSERAQQRRTWPDLDGRVSVITGAGQGIGRSFATAFAQAGARVVVADVNVDAAQSTTDELIARGHEALAIELDVADASSGSAMVAACLKRYGQIDALINNAAIFSTLTMKPFEEIAENEWRRVVDVNLTGVFLCCRAVSPAMRGQRSGSIINISSSTVLGGRPHYLHYVTAKSGVTGLTRSLARELGTHNITVNALMPGSVDTGIARDSARPAAVDGIVSAQALRRRIQPDDICGAALFLASDAARAITGQTIVIDGGMNFL